MKNGLYLNSISGLNSRITRYCTPDWNFIVSAVWNRSPSNLKKTGPPSSFFKIFMVVLNLTSPDVPGLLMIVIPVMVLQSLLN